MRTQDVKEGGLGEVLWANRFPLKLHSVHKTSEVRKEYVPRSWIAVADRIGLKL